MPQRQLLTIDFGTSGIKCMVFTPQGKALAKRFVPIQYADSEGLMGIGKEFDAIAAWNTIAKLIRDCLKDAKISSNNVVAVSATSQRHGAVFLDKKGTVIYSGPNLDARGVFVQDFIAKGLEDSCPPTGCWPPLLYSLSRLVWYKQNKPDLYAQIHHVLSINDWIIYQLTGEATTDPSQASNTQLMDIIKSKWSPEILEMAEISDAILPPIYESGSLVGNITAHASKKTGLSTKTVVGVGGADTQCAMLGTLTTQPGEVCVVGGNTAPIQLISKSPIIDESGKLWTGRYLLPQRWVLEANTGKAGAVLAWFVQNIVQPLSADLKDPQEAYTKVEQLAEKADIGSLDTIAQLGPQIMDASDMTTVRPALFFFPQPANPIVTPITMNELARSLFENICFAMRVNLELLQKVTERTFECCTVAGGLTRSQFWQQMLANVTGLEIHRGSEVEASSLGAAICAATAANLNDSLLESAEKMVSKQPPLKPQEDKQKRYETYFSRWQTLYKQSANL
ncbi:MAG: FGGY-family carbohydrate kinase [Candidatus Hermodarchaeota archaeon]